MKESKKVIRQTIEETFNQAMLIFDLIEPSKKTRRLIAEASKKISEQVKLDLKKKFKEVKLAEPVKKNVKKKSNVRRGGHT